MKYTSDIIQSAYAEIDRRRQKAVAEQGNHVAEIADSAPEIYSVYQSIRSTSSRLSKAVFFSDGDVRSKFNEIRNRNLSDQEKLRTLLAAFGYPEDYLDINYTCKDCQDTGIRLGNRCQCATKLMDRLTIEKLNKQCKIRICSFADFRLDYYPETATVNGKKVNCREMMEEVFKYCLDYANNFSENSPGILMLGGTGLGKTFLSSCIAGALLNKGINVAFDSIQNYLRHIENEHFGKTAGDTLEALLNADLLILDDLGCEFETPFNTSVIYNILNSRHNMGKPTIVSTNISIKDLAERYDDRITSRLIGGLKTLRFLGEDIRQIKRRNSDFT